MKIQNLQKNGGSLPLEAVLTTKELEQRPSRPPDYQAENLALGLLIQALADSPQTILQRVCEIAMELCQAGSAGISLLTEEDGGKNFYWPALSGQWIAHLGGGTPREFGPCGVVLDTNAVQLFSHPERYYPYLVPVSPPIEELLLTPFYIEGKAVGTVWVIDHDKRHKFDREDIRRLENLGKFASVAYQAWKSLENERRFRQMIDALPIAVYTTDAEGRLTHFNPAAVEAVGRMPQIGMDQWCISWKLYRADGSLLPLDKCPMAVTLQEGRAMRGEELIIERPDGGRSNIIPYPTPILNNEGKVVGGINMVLDITHRKQMEEELLKTSKLESIGLLAGGIAHDFNNLLASILGSVSLSKLSVPPRNKLYYQLGEAEKACLRGQHLTHQLLTFSRGGLPIMKTCAIADLLKQWVEFSFHGSNVRAQLVVQPDLWLVEGDEGQLNQVINNLVINAQQAMVEGGTVIVKAENLMLGTDHGIPLPNGKYVKISVADHGDGIPKELLTKIFEPFFTTKTNGSGLGLSTSYLIISKHNGRLTVESEPGKGTTVFVYLPASTKTIISNLSKPEVFLKGKGTVLFMDDEESIRRSMGELLGGIGYQVECVRDGAEAIERYRESLESGKPFDIVMLDLTVPSGLGGKETIKKLLELDPNVNAIVSSGYYNDSVMAQFQEYGFHGRLSKPYHIEALHETIIRLKKEHGPSSRSLSS